MGAVAKEVIGIVQFANRFKLRYGSDTSGALQSREQGRHDGNKVAGLLDGLDSVWPGSSRNYRGQQLVLSWVVCHYDSLEVVVQDVFRETVVSARCPEECGIQLGWGRGFLCCLYEANIDTELLCWVLWGQEGQESFYSHRLWRLWVIVI